MNAILRHNRSPGRLSVRSQVSTPREQIPFQCYHHAEGTLGGSAPGYIDHAIMFHASTSDRKGDYLVLHEEKVEVSTLPHKIHSYHSGFTSDG